MRFYHSEQVGEGGRGNNRGCCPARGLAGGSLLGVNNSPLCLLRTPGPCPTALPTPASNGTRGVHGRPAAAAQRDHNLAAPRSLARPPALPLSRSRCSPGCAARAVTSASREAGGRPGGSAAGTAAPGEEEAPPPPAPRSPRSPRPTSAARSPALSAPRGRP